MSAAEPTERCGAMRLLLAQRLDAALSPEQSAELAQHLAGCESCRHMEASLAQVDELARAGAPQPATPAHLAALNARIQEQLAPKPQRSRSGARWKPGHWPRWVLPIPAAAVLLLLLLLQNQIDPTPSLPVGVESEAAPRVTELDATTPTRTNEARDASEVQAPPSETKREQLPGSASEGQMESAGRVPPAEELGAVKPQPSAQLAAPAKDAPLAKLSQSAGKEQVEFAEPNLPPASVPAPQPIDLHRLLAEGVEDPPSEALRRLLAAVPPTDARAQRLGDVDRQEAEKSVRARRADELAPATSFTDSVRLYLGAWLERHPEHALADSVRNALE